MTHTLSTWEMGRRWLVVNCAPRSEAVASAKARELGFTVFYPHSRYMKAIAKKKPREVVEPYLPGYIFAVADRRNSTWDLEKAQGVQKVLRAGSEYAMIADTDPVMRKLLSMAGDGGCIERQEATKPITLIKAGDATRLKDGPFAGFDALVDAVDGKSRNAWVWVLIFGGKTRLKVAVEQLEPGRKAA